MRNAVLLSVCACGLVAAADAPYAGTWKMDPAKSDFGNTTVTYEQLPGGEMKATADGVSYTFKADGKDAMTPWGMTMAYKSTGPNSWDVTEKMNGKVTATSTMKLGADGKTLTMDSKRMKPDGTSSMDSMTFTRVSGGPGLAGKWQTKKMTSSSPDTLTLTPKGNDGVTIVLGNLGATCDAKFDGKDYPASGSMFPSGWTCAVAKSGARGIDLTWKKDGKDMYKSTLTASADGKMLTEAGGATGTSEKYKVVYTK